MRLIKNNYTIIDDVIHMEVKFKDETHICLIGIEDFEEIKLLDVTWRVKYNNKGNRITGVCYSKRNNDNGKTYFLHRAIMKCPPDKVVDHIDRNPLNNLKENLRVCTHEENLQNQSKKRHYKGNKPTSEYRGVSKYKGQFHVSVNGKSTRFTNEIAAANYYNILALEQYGDFANLNSVEYMSLEEIEKYRISIEKTKTSKYKGVSFSKSKGKWQSSYYDSSTKKLKYLGAYNDEELAYQSILDYQRREVIM